MASPVIRGGRRAENAGERGHRDWHFAALLGAFVVSRLVAHLAGVSMDTRTDYPWQLLDPGLLSGRLVESVFYLHAQPPVFNTLHGVVVKLAPSVRSEVLLWTGLQMTFGFGLLLGLYGTLSTLSLSKRFAAAATAICVCSPAALAYENLLSYTYMDASLLSLMAFALIDFLKQRRRSSIVAFFLLLATICLTRPVYHLFWLIAVAAMVVAQSKRLGFLVKPVAVAALAAILLVAGLYVKNWLVFGFAGPSSWSGMNVATMTHMNLAAPLRRELLAKKGSASPLGDAEPFLPLVAYPIAFRTPPSTGVPALDEELRFDGSPNFNNRNYLSISKQYGHDAQVIMAARPSEYAKSVVRNLVSFLFRSSTDYLHVAQNVSRMHRWNVLYSVLFYGQVGALPMLFASPREATVSDTTLRNLPLGQVMAKKAQESCLVIALLTLLLPGYAIAKAWKSRDRSEGIFVSFIAITVLYVAAASNLGNFGETHRMRFEIEPLLFILLGMLVQDLVAWRQKRRASGTPQTFRGVEGGS